MSDNTARVVVKWGWVRGLPGASLDRVWWNWQPQEIFEGGYRSWGRGIMSKENKLRKEIIWKETNR